MTNENGPSRWDAIEERTRDDAPPADPNADRVAEACSTTPRVGVCMNASARPLERSLDEATRRVETFAKQALKRGGDDASPPKRGDRGYVAMTLAEMAEHFHDALAEGTKDAARETLWVWGDTLIDGEEDDFAEDEEPTEFVDPRKLLAGVRKVVVDALHEIDGPTVESGSELPNLDDASEGYADLGDIPADILAAISEKARGEFRFDFLTSPGASDHIIRAWVYLAEAERMDERGDHEGAIRALGRLAAVSIAGAEHLTIETAEKERAAAAAKGGAS